MYEMYKEGMRKYETEEGIRISLVFNGARSRQVAGDLSLWRRERQGAGIGSLTIDSSTPLKLNSTLSRLVSLLIPSTHDGPIAQKCFGHPWRSPPTKAWSMTEPPPLPFKPRLLVACTDGWLLVINDTINPSKRLPVINDTSAKMTCVVIFQINVWWPVWSLACVAYDLYGCPLN